MPDIFSPATAFWNQRQALVQSRERLTALQRAVDRPGDLRPSQWAQWFAAALEFRPDLIVELGRGQGNSTCVFTEAANQLGDCRVLSLCLSPTWEEWTRPRVAKIVPPAWFAPLEARQVNILAFDMAAVLSSARRVLLLWDAHGYVIADYVLGYVLPQLQDRAHLVLMHDISDRRYTPPAGDYAGKPLWRGNNDGYTRLMLGHLNSAVEQVVPMVDFTSRNGLELCSSDHSFHTELDAAQAVELARDMGEMFSHIGDWFWFSLNGRADKPPISFPAWIPRPEDQSDKAFDAHGLLAPTPQNISLLQEHIRAMEHSPFWKLRDAFAPLLRARDKFRRA